MMHFSGLFGNSYFVGFSKTKVIFKESLGIGNPKSESFI